MVKCSLVTTEQQIREVEVRTWALERGVIRSSCIKNRHFTARNVMNYDETEINNGNDVTCVNKRDFNICNCALTVGPALLS